MNIITEALRELKEEAKNKVIAKVEVNFDPDRFYKLSEEEELDIMGYTSLEEFEEENGKEFNDDDFLEYIGQYDCKEFFEYWELEILKKEEIDYFSTRYYVEGSEESIEKIKKVLEDIWFITDLEIVTVRSLLGIDEALDSDSPEYDDQIEKEDRAVEKLSSELGKVIELEGEGDFGEFVGVIVDGEYIGEFSEEDILDKSEEDIYKYLKDFIANKLSENLNEGSKRKFVDSTGVEVFYNPSTKKFFTKWDNYGNPVRTSADKYEDLAGLIEDVAESNMYDISEFDYAEVKLDDLDEDQVQENIRRFNDSEHWDPSIPEEKRKDNYYWDQDSVGYATVVWYE